jgi:hypothetical protein
MRNLLYIFIIFAFFCSCNHNKNAQAEDLPWNVDYDPNHPDCFDTIVNEQGDSMLIIIGAIDSIP